MEQQIQVSLQNSLPFSFPSKEMDESIGDCCSGLKLQSAMSVPGEHAEGWGSCLGFYYLCFLSSGHWPFQIFFTTTCKKTLTPGSLTRFWLMWHNHMGVTNGQNILGYTMSPWFGRETPSKQDYGSFTCFVKFPVHIRSRLICSFICSWSLAISTALSMSSVWDTTLHQSILSSRNLPTWRIHWVLLHPQSWHLQKVPILTKPPHF